MKRLSVVFLVIAMFLAMGCATGQVQMSPESQEAIAKITARRVGYELEKSYPDISHEVLAMSKAILIEDEPDIITIVADRLAIILIAEIGDPLLAADISDILELIEVETGVEITAEQMAVIKAVAEGLVSGIEIAIHNRRSEKFHQWDK